MITTGEKSEGAFVFPASSAQARLWFIDQYEPNSALYNIPISFHLRGKLDVQVLEQSINELIARHEILRTTFEMEGKEPVQVVHPVLNLTLPVENWSRLEDEARMKSLLQGYAQISFDLRNGPLIRARLFRLGEDDNVLLLSVHHIVFDGWSFRIFLRELAAYYNKLSKSEMPDLPALTIQYADFALWERKQLQDGIFESQLCYWKNRLGGDLPVLQLLTDKPRPAVQTFRGASQLVILERELLRSLKTLAVSEQSTLFMVLLAAFNVLLFRYTGQEDIVVGTPIAGRNRPELEGLVGFFVNTLALRTDLTGEPTFRTLLRRVREVCLEAYENQDVPFERLVKELNPERDRSRSPLIQTMFVLQNTPSEELRLSGLESRRLEVGTESAKFEITVSLRENRGGVKGIIEYNTDLFDPGAIDRMIGHFRTLLEGIAADPDSQISQLPLLTEPERQRTLVEWNRTGADYPSNACIHELFEQQVERTPDAVAVAYENQILTYRELNARANQVAHYLRNLGVGPDVLIGICMERSLEMVLGILGILKAGGAYVPLDSEDPEDRLAFVVQDAGLSLVLAQSHLSNRLPKKKTSVVALDLDWASIQKENRENIVAGVTAENLAYVIYTSGSTGAPKGVQIVHRGVVRLLFGTRYAALDASRTLLQLSPITFDASTFELWGALLHGGRSVLFPGRIPTLDALCRVITTQEVNTLWLTASLFNKVVDENAEALSPIRQLLTGGEALSPDHVRRALMRLPATRIVNGYGPTETTTFACCYPIPQKPGNSASSIPIGRPISNTEAYVLDAHLQPVPIGVAGELYIGGAGLARGYLNRPELTAEKFIRNPFRESPGERLYKTGDLVRWLPDGNLEFLGRIDSQVKIRGHRIELGEIECALRDMPEVNDAVVLAREDSPGEKRLVAYVVPEKGNAFSEGDARRYLQQKLPQYMLPSALLPLEKLPLTPNGKIDKRALPAVRPERYREETSSPRPRTSTEARLSIIWADLLKFEQVGVHDNFFDMGGHSLLAIQLIARIKKHFGINLPVATLFQCPTVAELANLLETDTCPNPQSSLVPIRPKGARMPFFWVHGDSSTVLLSRYLDPDQPIYALEHQAQDGRRARFSRTETIATYYLDELRAIRPHGPYLLGGFSFGAVTAFEMAQQLRRAGEEVALLFMLDPSGMEIRETLPIPSTTLREKLRKHWLELSHMQLHEKLDYLAPRLKGQLIGTMFLIIPITRMTKYIRNLRLRCYLAAGFPLPAPLRSYYIVDMYRRALRTYVPQPYSGRILLFKSRKAWYPPPLDWLNLSTGALEVYEFEGEHTDLTKELYVAQWVQQLKASLDDVQVRRRFAATN
jgi:amino acid adenylation domain-containing protein